MTCNIFFNTKNILINDNIVDPRTVGELVTRVSVWYTAVPDAPADALSAHAHAIAKRASTAIAACHQVRILLFFHEHAI